MTFGTPRWGSSDVDARRLFDHYIDQGGNFFDTADIYPGGQSEALLGRFLADQAYASGSYWLPSSASMAPPVRSIPLARGRGNPNAGGAGAKNIHHALNGSLARLGTDYIDLYWMHIWDGVTPVEEIVQTLADLVRAGKIRYYGFSDMPAWLAMKATAIPNERRIPGPITMQVEYSLVARDIEREHVPVPVAREACMAVIPWSPLAGGFLSGKYRQRKQHASGRVSGANPFGDSKFSDKNWTILSVVREVAEEVERSPSQIALAWALGHPMVGSVLVGATRPEQRDDNPAALSCNLSAE